jgi:IclR helix-turn-helix domain
MLEQKVKSVRALERGLDVLLEIQSRRAASLHELHKVLGLSKATLLRMLVTLGGKGLIWQRLADGAYLPHKQNISETLTDSTEQIAEIASPHMATLSSIATWPSVLAVPRLDHVDLLVSSCPIFTRPPVEPISRPALPANAMPSLLGFGQKRQAIKAKNSCALFSLLPRSRAIRCAIPSTLGLTVASKWSCAMAGTRWVWR